VRPGPLLLGLVTFAAPVLVTGCGAGRSGGPSVSPCFRVLPAAHRAVGDQGAFVDVARIRGSRIDLFPGTQLPPSSTPTGSAPGEPATADTRRDICVVAYRGTFDPRLIPRLGGERRDGAYAVIVVGVRTQTVRDVFLTDRLPPPLRRH